MKQSLEQPEPKMLLRLGIRDTVLKDSKGSIQATGPWGCRLVVIVTSSSACRLLLLKQTREWGGEAIQGMLWLILLLEQDSFNPFSP